MEIIGQWSGHGAAQVAAHPRVREMGSLLIHDSLTGI